MSRTKILALLFATVISLLGATIVSAAPPSDDPPTWSYGTCVASESDKTIFRYHFPGDPFGEWLRQSRANGKCESSPAAQGGGSGPALGVWCCRGGICADQTAVANFTAVYRQPGDSPAAADARGHQAWLDQGGCGTPNTYYAPAPAAPAGGGTLQPGLYGVYACGLPYTQSGIFWKNYYLASPAAYDQAGQITTGLIDMTSLVMVYRPVGWYQICLGPAR